MGRNSRFTNEFKCEAIKLVKEQGYTQAEVAKRLGISSKNISRWITELSSDKNHQTKLKLTIEQEELLQLRKEVKRLKLEREILKKAAIFFVNESD